MPVILPADLLRPIVAHVTSGTDLCSLAMVCRTLREEAQRALFENAVVTVVLSDTKHQTHVPFLDAIIDSPDHLALMVRKFTIRICILRRFSMSERRAEDPSFRMATKEMVAGWLAQMGSRTKSALQIMHNLTHLRLEYYRPGDVLGNYKPLWFTSLLEACSFQLKVLVWNTEPISTNLQELIQGGFAAQTGITVLRLDCYLPDNGDPQLYTHLSTLLPALRTISAPWNIIRLILECGRVIPNVQIHGLTYSPQPLTAGLRDALRGVTSLWCNTPFRWVDFEIADLPNIISLQVGTIFEEDYAAIVALQKLKLLILPVEQRASTDSDISALMAQHLLCHSASLSEIYVEDYIRGKQLYECHTSSSEEGQVQTRVADCVPDIWRRQAGLEFVDMVLPFFD
ncbi:hypothetical protein D9619_013611 [Psilocybe cf. subviscida]|uniref:F-box domain-containing protein n=1 Tax=Psilocybe cf. subviscida TaxID=2480587 RepID=A0A8H5BRN3_9AGAR|nr:hypothetical protein D9619_013611 [Psilocybe cf. subviscida]